MATILYRSFQIFICLVMFFSCRFKKTDKIGQTKPAPNNLKEVGPVLVINLPGNYDVTSRQGVDYEDYTFMPIDTADHKSATGGIIFGNHVACHEGYLAKNVLRDTFPSVILEHNVDWIRYKIDSLHFAEAFLKGEFCALIVAMHNNEVDSFITVFKSLKRK